MMNEHKKNLMEEIEYFTEQEEGYNEALATAKGDDRDHFAKMALIYYRARVRAQRELNETIHP